MTDRESETGADSLDGVLVIDKPPGMTSHDLVVLARRSLGIRKIGHVGTLDPMATGVLPLVLGRATRLASLLSTDPKVYDATIRLGVVTNTFDITGTVAEETSTRDVADISRDNVQSTSRAFTGTFKQQPPPFSAKKIKGIRAHRLARRQRPVQLESVEVTVHRLDILDLDGGAVRCRVTCSTGFYMRALAHELGQALGCGGCLERLRRERSGMFTLEQAIAPELLGPDASRPLGRLIRMSEALPQLPTVVASSRGLNRVAHGNVLMPTDFTPGEGLEGQSSLAQALTGQIKVCDDRGNVVAIAERSGGPALHPRIVLV